MFQTSVVLYNLLVPFSYTTNKARMKIAIFVRLEGVRMLGQEVYSTTPHFTLYQLKHKSALLISFPSSQGRNI